MSSSLLPVVHQPDVGVSTLQPLSEVIAVPAMPVKPSMLIGRRIQQGPQYSIVQDDGTLIPTINVFLETRAGGLSVDVLWEASSTSKPNQKLRTISAQQTCEVEKHDVIGWCSFTAVALTTQVADIVSQVVHSPTETNPHHADVIARDWICIRSETDPDRKRKARSYAKMMCDFARSNGNFVGLIV